MSELAGSLRAIQRLPDGVSGFAADGRELRIEHSRGVEVDWIVIRAVICGQGDMDPQLVLERNGRLALAAIVLAHGTYWLRVALPLDSAELADPRRAIELVRDGAASLAPSCQPTDSPAFAHYAA